MIRPVNPSPRRWWERSYKQPRVLSLLLLGWLLSAGLSVVPLTRATAGDPVWIPAGSPDLTSLVRRIEESLETGVETQILDSIGSLAERLVDGDPGGSTPLGGGLSVGAGVYLRSTVSRLERPLQERVLDEIRLRTIPRVPESPLPGLDARADLRRTSLLMDLPDGTFPALLARSLAESALERGDLHTWQRSVERHWIQNSDLRPLPAPTPDAGPSIKTDSLLVPAYISSTRGNSDRFDLPWQSAGGRSAAVSDGSRVWIQFPGEIRAIDLTTSEEIWRRVVPQQQRKALPRTIHRPVRRGSMIISSFASSIEALDGATGRQIWRVDLDQILGPKDDSQSIRALSSPCRVPGGIVVIAVASRGDRLEAFASFIDETGDVRWVRLLGESTGSTWLALQASPAPPVSGIGRIYWSTGRGTIISLRTTDGAMEWIQDLNSPSSFGLRNHLIQNPASGELLRRSGSRLFALPPGAPGIIILDTDDGKIIETLPTRSASSWCLSARGDLLAVIEGSELSCWSCPPEEPPRFRWKIEIPSLIANEKLDVIAAENEGWWVSAGDAMISYDQDGVLKNLQGIGFSTSEIEPLAGALLARSGAEVRILVSSTAEDHWLDAISARLDERQRLDLAGNSVQQKALRRTVELQLGQTDVVFSEIDRIALETALISAESIPKERISVGWQRALHSKQIGALQCATMICTLMLSEAPRSLQNTLVESTHSSWVPAEVAFTHMLLELDQAKGGTERIAHREAQAFREAQDLIDSSSPERWQILARMRPGCPTGRKARLQAAESYYRMADMNRCLHQIDLLVIREPDTDEALIGKLRRSEVLRELGRMKEAIDEIEQLNKSHGNRIMTRVVDGIEQRITLRERLQELRDEISTLPTVQRNHPGLPLQLAWSGRLELGQTRSTEIWPLSDNEGFQDDPRVLILTTESAQLIDSRDGVLIWRTDLGRNPAEVRGGIVLTRRDIPSPPLLLDDTGLVFHDKNRVWRLQLENGEVAWSHQLPPSEELPEQLIRIEQSCAADGVLVLATEDDRFIAFDAITGKTLWQQPRTGALLDDPVIRDNRLLIGYAIPDLVEMRSLENGAITQKLNLDPPSGSLASAPLLLARGFIVAFERGRISRYLDDGTHLWSTDLPHIVSDVQLSPDDEQLLCELFWTADRPSILGLDTNTGKVGWQRKLAADRRRITSLQIDSDELLLVCGDFQNRSILKLRSTLAPSVVKTPEAELEWTHQLSPAYDSVELQPRGDWIIVADQLRGEVTILDRSTGTPLTARQGISAMTDHLDSLGRLHHASVIGNTLFTVSSRGAAGFRSITARQRESTAWQSMKKSTHWRDEAFRLFGLQESHKAINLLEDTILDLEVDVLERATASWILEGAERQRAKKPQSDHEIQKMQVAPLIDGSLDEPWNATQGIPLDQPRYVRGLQGAGEPRIPWQDRSDLSGRVFLGWSEEGLHIAVDIDDDNVTTHNRDAKRWIGDCLVLVLDTRGDGGVRPRSDDQVLTLAFVPPKPQPIAPEGEAEGEGEPSPPFNEEEEEEEPEGEHIVVRRADGTGAVYEMTIPWTSIAEQRGEGDSVPWLGMRMRIGLAITDDDTGRGATKYLGLTPGMVLHRDLSRIWEGCSPDLMLPVRLGR